MTILKKYSLHWICAFSAFCGLFFALGNQFTIPLFNVYMTVIITGCFLFVFKKNFSLGGFGKAYSIQFIIYGIFIFMSALNSGYGFDRVVLLSILKTWYYPVCGFFIFYRLRDRSLLPLSLFLLFNGLTALFVNYLVFRAGATVDAEGVGRRAISSFTGEEVRATFAVATAFPLCIIGFLFFEHRLAAFKIISITGCILAFVYSLSLGTRGLVVAVVPIFIIYFILNFKFKKDYILWIVVLFVISTVAIGFVLLSSDLRYIISEQIISRFTTYQLLDVTFSGRMEFWQYGIEKIDESLFGKGYVYTDLITLVSTHNTILELGVSYGIFSVFSFSAILFTSFLLLLKRARYSKRWTYFWKSDLLVISILLYFMVEAHIYNLVSVYSLLFIYLGKIASEWDAKEQLRWSVRLNKF